MRPHVRRTGARALSQSPRAGMTGPGTRTAQEGRRSDTERALVSLPDSGQCDRLLGPERSDASPESGQ